MSRLQIPATIADAPAASQPFLEAINKKLGVVPNLFRLMANSPAALEGYLGLAGALAKGALPSTNRRAYRSHRRRNQRLRLLHVGAQLFGKERGET